MPEVQPATKPRIEPEAIYTRCEVAHVFECSLPTVDRWINKRKIAFIKSGRIVRFRGSDLLAFAESNLTPAR